MADDKAATRQVEYVDPFGGARLVIDPWSANPLVDGYRAGYPELAVMADAEGPAPTMWNSGDLPPFLGSGLDPRTLQRMPWQVRHAMAQQERVVEVLNASEKYANDPDARLDSEGLKDYRERCWHWITGAHAGQAKVADDLRSEQEDALYETLFGAEERARRARTKPAHDAIREMQRGRARLGQPREAE